MDIFQYVYVFHSVQKLDYNLHAKYLKHVVGMKKHKQK